ncbi:MAG: hypothetical protein R3F11_05770 [Verrucomicrobiales bacterium]
MKSTLALFAAAALAASALFAQDDAPDQDESKPFYRPWEHTVERLPATKDPGDLLAVLGREGWELVTVLQVAGSDQLTYFFKRQAVSGDTRRRRVVLPPQSGAAPEPPLN